MDYDVTAVVKSIVASMEWEIRSRHFGEIKGQYICTLDNYHGSLDEVDASCSEIPDEHKSFNLIELEIWAVCFVSKHTVVVSTTSQ